MAIVCNTDVKGDVAELLAKLVSQTEEAIVCVECSTHSIILFNSGAERVFGWSAEEILGKDVTTIMPIQERKDTRVESVGTNRDGTTFPIELSISTIDLNGSEYCAAIVRKSEAAAAAELAAYRKHKKQQLLKEVGTIADLKVAERT